MGDQIPRILIVEDDVEMARFILRLLKRNGYDAHAVLTVAAAKAFTAKHKPDLYILDIELPDGDGISLCKELRRNSDALVLFLTGRSESRDKIVGLESGGDYYITKPYDKDEFLAVVHSLTRRFEHTREKIAEATFVSKGSLVLNIKEKSVCVSGDEVELTPKEFAVLLLLVQNENRELSSEEIYKNVWKTEMGIDTGVVRKLISQIKRKLDIDEIEDFAIQTRYGGGYTFVNESDNF